MVLTQGRRSQLDGAGVFKMRPARSGLRELPAQPGASPCARRVPVFRRDAPVLLHPVCAADRSAAANQSADRTGDTSEAAVDAKRRVHCLAPASSPHCHSIPHAVISAVGCGRPGKPWPAAIPFLPIAGFALAVIFNPLPPPRQGGAPTLPPLRVQAPSLSFARVLGVRCVAGSERSAILTRGGDNFSLLIEGPRGGSLGNAGQHSGSTDGRP